MRNLKRTLSLALAAVMLLGMMVVGTSAASFPDVTSAENVEAINVMKAVSAMVGNEKGEFEPAKAVTRNEMAVVMCNLMGLKAEDYAATCVFTDVPDWAKNYVAACNANGIVSGTSATTYSGDNTVTAAEAGLMMMKALGYFQNAPDFGDDWKLATIKQASKISLFKGVSSSADTALTRNDVAQLGLTALKADVVEFNGTVGTAINLPDGTSFTQGYVAKYDAVTKTETTAGTNYAGNAATDDGYGKQQLGEKLFATSADKAKLVLGSSTDEFGRATTKWTFDGKTASEISKEAKFTFNTKTSASDVAKAMKDYKVYVDVDGDGTKDSGDEFKKIENDTKYAATAKLYESDSVKTLLTDNNAARASVDNASETKSLATLLANLTKNGKLVEIYANDDKQVTGIVTTTYTLNKVTAVTERTSGDSKYTEYTVTGGTFKVYSVASKDEDDTAVVDGTLEKGSIVTTVQPTSGKMYIYATTKFTGTQSAKDSSTITVGGESHKVAIGVSGVAMTAFANSSTEADYYVDQFGCVVKSDAVAVETKYAVLDKIALVGASGTGTNQTAEAVIVFADGTTETVEVSKINGVKAKDFATTTGGLTISGSAVTGVAVNATMGSNGALIKLPITYKVVDGKYELTYLNVGSSALDTTKSGDVTTGNVTTVGVPTFNVKTVGTVTAVANNDTVYVVKTKSGSDDKFTAYTGFKNVPTIAYKATNTINVSYTLNDDGKVAFVYIDASAGADVGEAEAGDILYVTTKDYVDMSTADDSLYELKGIVNGEAGVTLKTKTLTVFTNLTEGALYELTKDGDGYVTAATIQNQDDKTLAYQQHTMLAGNVADSSDGVIAGFAYGDTTKVYVIDDDELISGDITSALVNDVIYVKTVKGMKGSSEGTAAEKLTIDTIYIIKIKA